MRDVLRRTSMAELQAFTCYSAPGKIFPSRTELLEHYKTEWHAYNLKRKVKQLPSISETMFKRVKQQIEQQRMILENIGLTKKNNHIKQNKKSKKKSASSLRRQVIEKNRSIAPPELKKEDSDTDFFLSTDQSSGADTETETRKGQDPDTGFYIDIEEAEKPINFCQSLFEVEEKPLFLDSIEANLDFMHKEYGFFVPDREYLTDIQGLLQYCSQKIRVGKMCLYCSKRFGQTNAVVQHMLSMQHCKLNLEAIPIDPVDEITETEPFHEFEEFYDFSSYNKKQKAEVELEMLPTGEILLKYRDQENRIVGNRVFRKYYTQHHRSVEDTDNVAIALNKDEERERIKRLLVPHKSNSSSSEVSLSKGLFHLMSKLEKRTRKRVENKRQYQQSKLRLRDGLQQNLVVRNKTTGKLDVSNC